MCDRDVSTCAGVILLLAFLVGFCDAQATTPSTAPAKITTGELDLTFTERSPLSSRKEIARRLSIDESEMGEDYDLAACPFKVYIPRNYDPATPVGVFVYLGYKDSVSVATPWEPALDRTHMIFITPMCHYGMHYPNSVPAWQVMGLAIDAVHNLKQRYNIDTGRIYRMSCNEVSMRIALASADVFTGLIVEEDAEYCHRMVLPDKRVYPPSFPPPPAALFREARRRGFVMIYQDMEAEDRPPRLIFATMKHDGFGHILPLKLSLDGDLHYPNFKPEWFEQTALPFLDAASAAAMKAALAEARAAPGSTPATTAAPASNPEAQHILSMAQLYIKNKQPKLARPHLEALLKHYPNDPAAATAKELLEQFPPE